MATRPPAKLFRIADESALVETMLARLFEAETRVEARLWRDLAAAAGGGLESVVLFGSRARRDRRPGSDADVLLVIREARAAGKVRKAALDLALRHGLNIQPILVTLSSLPTWSRQARGLWRRILAEGRVVHGASLYDLERHVSKRVAKTGSRVPGRRRS